MTDPKLLSYHDVVLRQSDVDLLTGPYWLNDQIIAFYLEYLTHEAPRRAASGGIRLLPGAVSFLLRNIDPSEAAMLLEPLQLHAANLVLFAVNDNPDADQAAGGSHWSLLAFHRPSNTFRHYDSLAATNRGPARDLAGAATPLVRARSPGGARLPAFIEVEGSPRQRNGHDCGVYVCAVAEALVRAHVEGGEQGVLSCECELAAAVTGARVAALRSQLLGVIQEKVASVPAPPVAAAEEV